MARRGVARRRRVRSAWRARGELRLRRREHGHPRICGDGIIAALHRRPQPRPDAAPGLRLRNARSLNTLHARLGRRRVRGRRLRHQQRKRGIATAALEGGGPAGWQSWNAGGSSSSPGPRGATCKPGSTDYCTYYAETCDCENSDGCWWTTCEDSTQVLLDALEAVKKMLCVDLEQVWVAGCSNGAMMVYEALADPRTAGIFVGAACRSSARRTRASGGRPLPQPTSWGSGASTTRRFRTRRARTRQCVALATDERRAGG